MTFSLPFMLRLLHKYFLGVREVKKKLIKFVPFLTTILFLGWFAQPTLAEESINSTSDSTVKTSETTSSSSIKDEAVDASNQATKTNAETTAAEVKSLVENKIGEVKAEELSQVDFSSGDSIRDGLLSDNYGITKDQVDRLTNEQLVNGMTLFNRYQQDIIGMDVSSYARLLKALYIDQTLSWEKASEQLSFDPNRFNNFAEMISYIDELQAYLQALYPENSSFFATDSLTNDELIQILNQLNEIGAGPFGGGRIANIISRMDKAIPKENNASVTSSSKEQKAETINTSSAKSKKKDGNLPQTGEQRAKMAVMVLGILLVIGVILLFIVRRKKKK